MIEIVDVRQLTKRQCIIGAHDGKNIGSALFEIFSEAGVVERIGHCAFHHLLLCKILWLKTFTGTADNASNNETALKTLGLTIRASHAAAASLEFERYQHSCM